MKLHRIGLSVSLLVSLLRAPRESVSLTTFDAGSPSCTPCTYLRATSIVASSSDTYDEGSGILNNRLISVEGQKKAAEALRPLLRTEASVNTFAWSSKFSNKCEWANWYSSETGWSHFLRVPEINRWVGKAHGLCSVVIGNFIVSLELPVMSLNKATILPIRESGHCNSLLRSVLPSGALFIRSI
uniref:Putative secreted protein n=1 Tax=Rhipicephalus microplus TaxID=6941 RepID=A0A6G5A2J5_RHIMP